jgi:hypothetical protein
LDSYASTFTELLLALPAPDDATVRSSLSPSWSGAPAASAASGFVAAAIDWNAWGDTAPTAEMLMRYSFRGLPTY